MKSPAITVILCAHNPREQSLSRVLAALAGQTLSPDLWELVLVDNASVPPLGERNLALPPNSRTIVETVLGLTPARLAGLAAARGSIIVLIDDDTVPDLEYLATALKLMTDSAEIGAAGGRIQGEFGAPVQSWMAGFLDLLAIRDFGDRPIRALIYNQVGPWEPCGAGMVVKREVASAYARRTQDESRRRLDRVGTSLSSCGDTDLARTASDLGLHMAYEPGLSLTHLIPAGRMTLGYLARLAYCVQRDGWLLYRLRGKNCALTGRSRWAQLLTLPFRTMALDPRRWVLRFASAYGQIRGRSQRLNTVAHE